MYWLVGVTFSSVQCFVACYYVHNVDKLVQVHWYHGGHHGHGNYNNRVVIGDGGVSDDVIYCWRALESTSPPTPYSQST